MHIRLYYDVRRPKYDLRQRQRLLYRRTTDVRLTTYDVRRTTTTMIDDTDDSHVDRIVLLNLGHAFVPN